MVTGKESERTAHPQGAPNVVVVLLDDMGFGAPSAFGGPCQMPTADRLAGNGVRLTRFHTTGVCSPTRAALLTGRNHHTVGMGHIAELASEQPGYDSRIPASAAGVARILRDHGYATGYFGKAHEMPSADASPAGPFDLWPTGPRLGFEKFYGFLGGATNHWYPTLVDGTTAVDQPALPEDGYHLSEDLVDRAIGWISDVRSLRPGTPFFTYLSFGATHAPFHVAPEWAEKYRGKFDHGWDRQREITLRRQRELGIVPPDTELSPWMPGVPHWDELDETERAAAALLMELYAGFAEHTDIQVGRFVDALDQLDVLENTLFLYILGDNGASAEGGPHGSLTGHFAAYAGVRETAADVLAGRETAGGPDTWPHYPAGWAFAMDTPYPWVKQIASHFGGTRNGLIAHWPQGLSDDYGALRHQWHHVIDVVPTILEATGVPMPETVDGVSQLPLAGRSMVPSLRHEAQQTGRVQYFEIHGNRAIYRDGWIACALHRQNPWDMVSEVDHTLAEDVWELYDTENDWSESRDLAGEQPELLAELKELFLVEAGRNGALPLDSRPPAARRNRPSGEGASMTFRARARRIPHNGMPNVLGRSHCVSAEIRVSDSGGDGVVCAQGGRAGGWSLYLHDGCLTYCHSLGARFQQIVRSAAPIGHGAHEVRMEFSYDGGPPGRGGSVVLFLDDQEVGRGRVEHTVAFLFPPGEDFNVGVDPQTPVSGDYCAFDNGFQGTITWVRIDTTGAEDASAASGRARAAFAIQ